MKKYLIIGANSFLGNEIIHRLKSFHEVTGVFHENTCNLHSDISNIPINELDSLEDKFDIVMLLSAYIPSRLAEVNKSQLLEVNQELPKRIVKKFRSAKIIYASSVSVYGLNNNMINEDTETKPNSAYGASKLAGELEVSKHKDYSIIRISSMYGIGMNISTFVPQIIQSALNKKKIEILGDGQRLQNYIHVSDVADFFIKVADINANITYLATAERSTTNKEVAKIIQNLLPSISLNFKGLDESPSFKYNADKSYKKVSFKPLIGLEEGLKELIKWQQKKF